MMMIPNNKDMQLLFLKQCAFRATSLTIKLINNDTNLSLTYSLSTRCLVKNCSGNYPIKLLSLFAQEELHITVCNHPAV